MNCATAKTTSTAPASCVGDVSKGEEQSTGQECDEHGPHENPQRAAAMLVLYRHRVEGPRKRTSAFEQRPEAPVNHRAPRTGGKPIFRALSQVHFEVSPPALPHAGQASAAVLRSS